MNVYPYERYYAKNGIGDRAVSEINGTTVSYTSQISLNFHYVSYSLLLIHENVCNKKMVKHKCDGYWFLFETKRCTFWKHFNHSLGSAVVLESPVLAVVPVLLELYVFIVELEMSSRPISFSRVLLKSLETSYKYIHATLTSFSAEA